MLVKNNDQTMVYVFSSTKEDHKTSFMLASYFLNFYLIKFTDMG